MKGMSKMKKFAKFKSQKGFTGVDVGIAVLILILFTSVIATLYYQIFYKSTEIKRNSTASGYAIAIVEKMKQLYYSDISVGEYLTNAEEKEIFGIELEPGYNAKVTVSKFGDENSLDFVKEVNVIVTFKLAGIEKSVSMNLTKAKEIVDIPNKPILTDTMSAVKYINGSYQVINPDETVWYNYEDKEYAYVYIGEKLSYGTKLTETQQANLYMWIPRFAYSQNNIVFYIMILIDIEIKKIMN